MLYVKYGKKRLHGFRGDVWKCWRRTTTTVGRRMSAYTMSSPMSLRLRWAKTWLISQSCYFVKKHFFLFLHQTFSCKCSMSLHFVGKVLNWMRYKLNFTHMHYLYTCQTKLLGKISNQFAKKNFWHPFMHMLSISVLYMQSIRRLQ